VAGQQLVAQGILPATIVTDYVAAISVGIVHDQIQLDLAYEEDSSAQVDMNVVMTGSGKFVEVQATAEGRSFSQAEMNMMLQMAETGIRQLIAIERTIVPLAPPARGLRQTVHVERPR